DGLADGGGDRELVRAVTEGHEGAAERDAVDRTRDLDETARAEDRSGVRHLDAGPRVAVLHATHGGRERDVERSDGVGLHGVLLTPVRVSAEMAVDGAVVTSLASQSPACRAARLIGRPWWNTAPASSTTGRRSRHEPGSR